MSIPRIAKAMDYIDDDLVSGAVDYKRTKKKHGWLKWGAMAACLCLVVVGAVTVFPYIQNTVDPLKEPVIDNTNDSTTTNPIITTDVINMNNVAAVPEMLLPFLGEDNCTPMTNSELAEYYGIDIQAIVPSGFSEVDGRYQHGLYSFTDGTFDMNHFRFVNDEQEIEIYIGKETDCTQYADNLVDVGLLTSTINGTGVYLFSHVTENSNVLYSIFEYNECDLIVISYDLDEQAFVSTLKAVVEPKE